MRLRTRSIPATVLAALLALAAGVLAPGVAAAGSGGGGTVRIGLEAPLSGDQSTIGKGMLNGAKLAAKQLNAATGHRGQAGRDRRDRRRGRPADGRHRRERGHREGSRRGRRPLQLGSRRRDPSALHQCRARPDPADVSRRDRGAGLHVPAHDVADRARRGPSADRLAEGEDGRDRVRPDRAVHAVRLRCAEAAARAGRGDDHGVRADPAGREELHRRGPEARGDEPRRDLRRDLLP